MISCTCDGLGGSVRDPQLLWRCGVEGQRAWLGQRRDVKVPEIALDAEPWTPENDMVTAAFKLKRANIYERFRGAIDGMYAGGGR